MDRVPGVYVAGGPDRREGAGAGGRPAAGAGAGELRNQAKDKWVPPSMQSGMNFTIDQEELRREKYVEAVRSMTGTLNKVTPENFAQLSGEVVTKYGEAEGDEELIKEHCQLVFEKALSEPHYASMWGDLCTYLSGDPSAKNDTPDIHSIFRSEVLNMCQREFERMKEELKMADEDFEPELYAKKKAGTLTEDELNELEERRVKRGKRRLGTIKFIGELFMKRLLTKKIMHYCLQKLFSVDIDKLPMFEQCQNIDYFCKLVRTVGAQLDSLPKDMKTMSTTYFDRMAQMVAENRYPPRIHFMLEGVIELRSNNWVDRHARGPKPTTISQVHTNAALKAKGIDPVEQPKASPAPAPAPVKKTPQLSKEAAAEKVTMIVKEYLFSHELEEAVLCVQELEAPQYNSLVVETATNLVLESLDWKTDAPKLCKLLVELKNKCNISTKEFGEAFKPALQNLGDLAIDVPVAPQVLKDIIEHLMKKAKVLPPDFLVDYFQQISDSKHQTLFFPLLP